MGTCRNQTHHHEQTQNIKIEHHKIQQNLSSLFRTCDKLSNSTI